MVAHVRSTNITFVSVSGTNQKPSKPTLTPETKEHLARPARTECHVQGATNPSRALDWRTRVVRAASVPSAHVKRGGGYC